jgi:hypothetical protein
MVPAPTLMTPVFKLGCTFQLPTGASYTCLGSILEQFNESGKFLGGIQYGSSKLCSAN